MSELEVVHRLANPAMPGLTTIGRAGSTDPATGIAQVHTSGIRAPSS